MAKNGTIWGVFMYKRSNRDQLKIEDFFLPFGGKLDANNRWVKLAEDTPWDRIEDFYLETISEETGRNAIPARIAFGAICIWKSEGLSDEDVVRYIQENPYVQYYLGLHEFRTEPLFDSSMMVHFRKRFPVEFIAKVNECICTGKWPEEMRNVDRDDDDHKGGGSGTQKEKDPEENPANVSNSGTLIIDATVADADIKYPTDIDLLNQCREHLEEAINLLWPFVSHDRHKYPYSQKKARKAFLNISKSKKWTKKKLYIGIGQQLDYIERATERLHQMQSIVTDWEDKLPGWLKDRLNVIPKVYLQQKEMHENGTHKSDDRIVSLQQPHIRPIVRGKRPEPTEFGQKLHLSVVDGYTFIEQTSWNNFNEGKDLPAAVENYRRRYGCYPKAVLADKLYQTRENRKYCKDRNIRISGPKLGRPKAGQDPEEDQKQMYQDACDRNVIEGKNGTAKRRYGLSLICSKLDETSKTEAALSILMMNAWKRVYEELFHFLFHILGFTSLQSFTLLYLPVFQ